MGMKQENIRAIGQNLKRLRLEHGLTQQNVATRLGVSFQQMQKYETGQNKLPIESLFILKHYYNTTFDIFFHGVDSEVGACNQVQKDLSALTLQIENIKDNATRYKIVRILQILLS